MTGKHDGRRQDDAISTRALARRDGMVLLAVVIVVSIAITAILLHMAPGLA